MNGIKELSPMSWKMDRPPCIKQTETAIFASHLRRCGITQSLSEGRQVHANIIKNGLERNSFLQNVLVQMYGKCGALEEAEALFANMDQRDTFSWTFMIAAYSQHGQGTKACELFYQMSLEDMMPNKFTYISVLSACASQETLAEGKKFHTHILHSGNDEDVVVATSLVQMYSRCGSLSDAQKLFDSITERDIVLWNTMIVAYAHHGQGLEALQLFQQMRREELVPDKFTFVSILHACALHAVVAEGKQIHKCIVHSGCESDVTIGNALIHFYSKCGSLDNAQRMFDNMPKRDVITWNAMIAAYSQHGHGKKALRLFHQMQLKGMKPNKVTLISIISARAGQATLIDGKSIRSHIVDKGYDSDLVLGNALVKMNADSGELEAARKIFEKMPGRDIVSWNAMIAAYAQNGRGREALQLFKQLYREGFGPNKVTFVRILSVCAYETAIEEGKWVHDCIVETAIDVDVILGTALANMYGKCGTLEDARRVFDRLHERDVVLWNAMIAAYAQHGQGKEALQLFQYMQNEGPRPNKITFISTIHACASEAALAVGKYMHSQIKARGFESDVVVGNALINMYQKCGNLEDAQRMFDEMPQRDVVSCNTMIAAHAQHGEGKNAFELFEKMQQKRLLDEVTFVNIFSACASWGALAKGKEIHSFLSNSKIESNIVVRNAIINMYGQCGSLEDAVWMFDTIVDRTVVSWSTMIATYAQHGRAKKAFQLFEQMQSQGLTPNVLTFVGVLTACSHAGLVNEGYHFFSSMNKDHGIIPTVQHYNCVIGLLGRIGRLDEGEDLINNMPLEPTAASWLALLGACRSRLDVDRGEHAARRVSELESENATPYVLLSNIYLTARRWNDATDVRKVLKENGRKQNFGQKTFAAVF